MTTTQAPIPQTFSPHEPKSLWAVPDNVDALVAELSRPRLATTPMIGYLRGLQMFQKDQRNAFAWRVPQIYFDASIITLPTPAVPLPTEHERSSTPGEQASGGETRAARLRKLAYWSTHGMGLDLAHLEDIEHTGWGRSE